MPMKVHQSLWSLVSFAFAAAAYAADVQFSSGEAQTVLIELYTSQGCNSCPRAEEYLNTYVGHPGLWTDYVPLAFHVNYWDYLGWKDRFAHPGHTRRQRRHARLGHLRAVYTPAFVVNGREWGLGSFAGEPDVARKPAGTLSVRVAGDEVAATFEPVEGKPGELALNIAVLGMDISTEITAGENKGRRSNHDFVVLGHDLTKSGNGRWQAALPIIPRTHAGGFALAVWVTRPGTLVPVQATGAKLPAEWVLKPPK